MSRCHQGWSEDVALLGRPASSAFCIGVGRANAQGRKVALDTSIEGIDKICDSCRSIVQGKIRPQQDIAEADVAWLRWRIQKYTDASYS